MNRALDTKLNLIKGLGFDVTIKWDKEIYASINISCLYSENMESIIFKYFKKDKEIFEDSIDNFVFEFLNWRNENKSTIETYMENKTEKNLLILEEFYKEI